MRDPLPALLFDLDGTLLDTIGDLAASLRAVRDSVGLPPVDEDFVRRGIGHGLDALLRHGLADLDGVDLTDEAQLAPFRDRWREHYRANVCVHTRAFEHVEDALATLEARGHAMAIVSNKPESFCRQLVAEFGWQQRFPVVVGGDTLATRKPEPAPLLHACDALGAIASQAWMIGDSPADVTAGARAGCARRIACTWGYRSRAELERTDPTDVADSFAEVAAWILEHDG